MTREDTTKQTTPNTTDSVDFGLDPKQLRDARVRDLLKRLKGLKLEDQEKAIQEFLLDLDLPAEVKEAAQKALKNNVDKIADKSIDLQVSTLDKIYTILYEASQKANDAQLNNTNDYRQRFADIQQDIIRKYISQATAGNTMMAETIGPLAMAAGILFSAFGNAEKGTELITMGQHLIDHYSGRTLALKKQIEPHIYGPDAAQIAIATQGNKALGQSIQGQVGPLVDYQRNVGGMLTAEDIVKRINDAVDNPRSPQYKPKSFSADGYYPRAGAGAAGGAVKNHKADTVKPYSALDVRKHAAAAIAPSKWDPTILAAAEKIGAEMGVPAAILAMEAKIRIGPESGGNPNAWNRGAGAKGENAYGLMQLEEKTAARYGVKNITDPKQNLEGGMRFIADIVNKYGRDNVDRYYYGGEGTKDHGPNTMQYVENLAAVRALLPKEGIVLAGADAKLPAPKGGKGHKKVAEIDIKPNIKPDIKPEIKPDFSAVASLTGGIEGTDTRGFKTDAGTLLARHDENKKVGDPTKTAQNDTRYRLTVNEGPQPGGGLAS